MTVDSSIFGYFIHASLIVKIVMLLLLAASFTSWMIIFQRGSLLKLSMRATHDFENQFWSITDLSKFYQEIMAKEEGPEGLERIFSAGFKEFVRLQKQANVDAANVIAGVQRAMTIAEMQVADQLEGPLDMLATIGSVSPYIGLFGTVWGIMTAFQALGHVSEASIAMVAPGISEALIATAMGLFAAIPAVIFYNRYRIMVERLLDRGVVFREEFSNYLYRQIQSLIAER